MKQAICIDTHALIWHVSQPARLGKTAKRLLRRVDAGKLRGWIPAIVPVELALLRDSGRRVIGPGEVQALLAVQPSFRLLALDLAQAMEFALLTSLRDPFDRLIVAAARTADAVLITADERLHEAGVVETAWD